LNCPNCQHQIETDSLFCDQCGKELFLCPTCGKFGKGKICTQDGSRLVSVKEGKVDLLYDNADLKAKSAGFDIPKLPQLPDDLPKKLPDLHLINKNLNLDLKIQSGDIIGRNDGRFTDIFGKYSWISGRHLKFEYDHVKGWQVIDMNSKNGAKYNNLKLTPMQPMPMQDGSFLLIAKIEFYIKIDEPKGRIKTETIRLR
jgi:hypothetical protein